MNQSQRKFLIDRITKKGNEKIHALRGTRLSYPSASNYIFKAILNGELKLQDEKVIMEALRQKALAAKEGENWLSDERMGANKENSIRLLIRELVVIPEDYHKELERVREHNKAIEVEVDNLKIQIETIEVRVQLASDKNLQNMINEVDDMGNLSLIDTKIKLLK